MRSSAATQRGRFESGLSDREIEVLLEMNWPLEEIS